MKEFIDKLIERLKEAKDRARRHYNYGNETAYGYAIEIVNELAEEYEREHIVDLCNQICNKADEILQKGNNGWIPCSERLPELTEGTECFKQSKCCLVTLKWWDGDMTESVGWYNQSGVWNEDSKKCKVIAWMPLPAPYTEGE